MAEVRQRRCPDSAVPALLVAVLVVMAGVVWLQVGRPPPPLLVLSLGGLRHDYLSLLPADQLPFFTQLLRDGAHAEWLSPTFPSEVATRASLFTGLYPERHGVLGPHLLDRAAGELRLPEVDTGVWWAGAAPLWSSAVRQWRRTAVVGLEAACAPLQGTEPTFCLPPGEADSLQIGLDQVLDRLLQTESPFSLAILHSDALRRAAEQHGAASAELLAALRALDQRLQQLDRRLAGRSINIVIVSDGGLADTAGAEAVPVASLLPEGATATLAGGGASVLGYMATEHAQAAAALAADRPGLRAYLGGALPPRLRLAHPRRQPNLLLCAQPGFLLETGRQGPPAARATAGYDDTAGGAADMRGVLLARGPGVRRGAAVPPSHAVDVYPLLAALSGVAPEPHSGQLSNVAGMLL